MRTSSKAPSGGSGAWHLVDLAKGEHVFREGDLGTEMYIIREGRIEILQESPEGSEQLAVLEKGDFFGEMSLLEELPRSASARALSDVQLVRVDGSTFDKMLRSNLEIAVRIMRKLSRRLRQADEMLRELGGPALGSVAGRAPGPASTRAPSGARSRARPPAAGEEGAPAPALAATHRLLHKETGTGIDFDAGAARLVGRHDPVTGIRPEIDLSEIDPERSSSRRHAKIFGKDGRLYLVEDIGTTNGTFLNDARIKTGVPVEIRAGDSLRFGLVAVELRSL